MMLGNVYNCSKPQFPCLLMRIIITKPLQKVKQNPRQRDWLKPGSWEMSPLVLGDRPSGVTVIVEQM